MRDVVKHHLEELGLSPQAVNWLVGLWNAIQVLDDARDGDENPDALQAAWDLFVEMPTNSFFLQNSAWLLPVLRSAVIGWIASDRAEREGRADARSYVWRAGFYDVIAMALSLEGKSPEDAGKALAIYGESLDEYLKEFGNA